MRSRYKINNPGNIYFVTSSIVNFINIFISEKYIKILLDTLAFNQKDKNLQIFAYVIMENHFHLLCSADKLSNVMLSIKSYSAKKIIQQLKEDNKFDILKVFEENKLLFKTDRKYQIWQEGFHPEEIMSDEMYRQKIDYIHYNPVKANYVDDILKWKYSSAIDYYTDEKGMIELDIFENEKKEQRYPEYSGLERCNED
jgi:putative transposase